MMMKLVLSAVTVVLIMASAAPTSATHTNNYLTLERIQRYLDNTNKLKLAMKTIQLEDGDIIDCVPMLKQHALDHPKLKNHILQEEPSSRPKVYSKSSNGSRDVARSVVQLWHESGEACPKGTIPVRRVSMNDVLRAKSLFHFGKKVIDPNVQNITQCGADEAPYGSLLLIGHEHAVASTSGGGPYNGVKASINAWAPFVQEKDEFSLAQVWVIAGSYASYDLNTVEAGWQVFPSLYGDNNPRLFAYWTRDAYASSGCYNHKCPGFIQISNNIVLGGSLSPTSLLSGPQNELTILIWKDVATGNWWLRCQDINVGYWPRELFTKLGISGETVQWGGEVFNRHRGGKHTTTQMGSGRFPNAGFGQASYIRNMQVVDYQGALVSPEVLVSIKRFMNCYNIQIESNEDWGDYLYFGGPGRNPQCP